MDIIHPISGRDNLYYPLLFCKYCIALERFVFPASFPEVFSTFFQRTRVDSKSFFSSLFLKKKLNSKTGDLLPAEFIHKMNFLLAVVIKV